MEPLSVPKVVDGQKTDVEAIRETDMRDGKDKENARCFGTFASHSRTTDTAKCVQTRHDCKSVTARETRGANNLLGSNVEPESPSPVVVQGKVNSHAEHEMERMKSQKTHKVGTPVVKNDTSGFSQAGVSSPTSSDPRDGLKSDGDSAETATSTAVSASRTGDIIYENSEGAMGEERCMKRMRIDETSITESPCHKFQPTEGRISASRDNVILQVTAGVSVGDAVEIRWIVSRDANDDNGEDEESEEIVWWRGVVQEPEIYEKDSEGRRIWQINYESQDDFPAEECRVVFLNNVDVYHVDRNATLKYRKFGEPSPPGTEDSDDEDNHRAVLTMNDIIEAQKHIDEEEGDSECGSAEAAMMSAFSSLPFMTQMNMASTYRQFADSFKDWLHQRVQEKKSENADVVITSEDIKQFIQCAKQKSLT